ncbi:MAG: PIN domain-containing protein [Acidobacteria bacterium]|nr:PIN domain-containing protein [Acidobacteriota bacterium]
MMQVLLDSDVLLDYVLPREDFQFEAEQLFDAIADQKFVAFVSAIALLNVHYFAEKEHDRHYAKAKVAELLSLINVAQIGELTFHNAFDLPIDDYEDAVQCASAVAEGLDAIVTRNVKDFASSPLPVYSPAEFVALIQAEQASEEAD